MLKKKLLTDRTGDLAEAYIEEAGKKMAQDIDREILWGMLEGIGWTRVMITQRDDWAISVWLEENCEGAYEQYRTDYIFESKKDAAWFVLRWL